MARILILGCGCRGRELAELLVKSGHAVRGTTRDVAMVPAIEATGAEAVVCDPDRIGTVFGALDGVTVLCILLGSASGEPSQVAALHGTRLEMLLFKLIDTTVRGVVYEACGSIDPAVLSQGASTVRAACEQSRIPYSLLLGDGGGGAWPGPALAAVDGLLGG